jgi:N-acetylmuramate 1-kinase
MGIDAATATSADLRELALARYAERRLGTTGVELVPASGDASFRRYFRVALPAGGSVIAMDAPPEHEDLARFVRIACGMEEAGLHVPHVIAADYAEGYALISDLGSETYLMRLEAGGDPEPLYAAAIDALIRLQRWPGADLPPYNADLLDGETKLFEQWLLERHLGLELTDAESRLVARVRQRMTELALAQPVTTVHRDYHSRNLMVCEPLPGVLDFQDAVQGPVTYDLVSLLEDCYVEWPRERRLGWLRDYRRQALAAGLPAGRDEAEFAGWFDTMGMQRHLKAAGIFARLWHRDGKPGYLADIPRTLGYVVAAARALPAFADFGDFVADRVLPQLVREPGP